MLVQTWGNRQQSSQDDQLHPSNDESCFRRTAEGLWEKLVRLAVQLGARAVQVGRVAQPAIIKSSVHRRIIADMNYKHDSRIHYVPLG